MSYVLSIITVGHWPTIPFPIIYVRNDLLSYLPTSLVLCESINWCSENIAPPKFVYYSQKNFNVDFMFIAKGWLKN